MKTFTGFTKGINLGGWLSQCGDKYNDAHYSTFIQKKDIEVIAGYGVDHVRLPLDYNVVQNDDGSLIERRFAYIDDCISWCEEYHLNLVLDLHKTCGYVFDDENENGFFSSEKLQDQFVYLWQELARRYGNKENIAFELLNEITAREMAEPWNKIVARTIPEIRKIAPTTKIIVGGIFNSSIYGLTLLDAPADENIVFTIHCYSPLIFTHQNAYWVATMPKGYHTTFPKTTAQTRAESEAVFGDAYADEFTAADDKVLDKDFFKALFERAIAISEENNVPLYCGEYGVIDQADSQSTLNWFRAMHAAMEECNMARSVWTYKEMDFGIISPHCQEIYDELVNLL